MKKNPFTLIEMITVMTIMLIIGVGGIVFVADLVKSRQYISLINKRSADLQFALQRLTKEISSFGRVGAIAPDGKSITLNAPVGSISWNSSSKILSLDGSTLVEMVDYFSITRSGQVLEMAIEINGSPRITMASLVRE